MVTSGIGTFSVTVPTKKNGSSYFFNDIDLYDTVKIWLGYDSISGDPIFIGKVAKINAPLSTQSGYVRQISGFSQGEILHRRLKRWKTYDGVGASTIVEELADDLSLGKSKITSDSTEVTMHIENESYFDLLTRISDYWYSAGSQIKKDFFVDTANDLVWKDRPMRTSEVETPAVGTDISLYVVTRLLDNVKNKIYVYGLGQKQQPEWRDWWTENTTNWTGEYGSTLSFDTTKKVLGDGSIKCYDMDGPGNPAEPYARRDLKTVVDWSEENGVARNFHIQYRLETSIAPDGAYIFRVYLFAPDASNMAYKEVGNPDLDTWHEATWSKTDFTTYNGTPDYKNITAVRCYAAAVSVGSNMTCYEWVDDIYFSEGRTNALCEDATSQANYGVRESQYVDRQLVTSTECTSRGNTLLYQLKTAPIQTVFVVPGNTNYLVGDRLSITIPAEDITSTFFYILSVEHSFSNQTGFLTKPTMINSMDIRRLAPNSSLELMADMYRGLRELTNEVQVIG